MQPQRSEHTLLCIVAALFPVVGAGFGIWGITRSENPAWQNTGRSMLTWAVVGVAANVILGIVIFGASFAISMAMMPKDLGTLGTTPAIPPVADEKQLAAISVHDLSAQWTDTPFGKRMKIYGQVTNGGRSGCSVVTLKAVLFDSAGTIIATDTGIVADLAASHTKTFDVGPILDGGDQVSKYTVEVESLLP